MLGSFCAESSMHEPAKAGLTMQANTQYDTTSCSNSQQPCGLKSPLSCYHLLCNYNYMWGNPQPEAIGHTQTCLQPESGGR